MIRRIAIAAALAALTCSAVAHAGTGFDAMGSEFKPLVPVSAFSGLSNWFDPSRLHMSSTLSVGSGFGTGTNALQVTSFSYQFRAPVSMDVSVGNAFGPGSASGSSMFLEGLNLHWQPNANSTLSFQYQNVRSPLQYGFGGPGRPYWGR